MMIRPAIRAIALILIVVSFCFSQTTPSKPPDSATPVLVELFTSEGCSTCPPADRFLSILDTQPLTGIEFVVLSEHVDYWNHDGWKDRFSAAQFTERQQSYVSHFRLASAYTPQLVIDGNRQMSGVSVKEADAAFKEAMKVPKVALRITETAIEKNRIRAHVEIAGASAKASRPLDIYVLTALNRAETQVEHGENAHRHLTHTAVVLTMSRVGKLKAGENLSRDVDLKVEPGVDLRNLRVVTFLQDPDSLTIYGATMRAVNTQHAQ